MKNHLLLFICCRYGQSGQHRKTKQKGHKDRTPEILMMRGLNKARLSIQAFRLKFANYHNFGVKYTVAH